MTIKLKVNYFITFLGVVVVCEAAVNCNTDLFPSDLTDVGSDNCYFTESCSIWCSGMWLNILCYINWNLYFHNSLNLSTYLSIFHFLSTLNIKF